MEVDKMASGKYFAMADLYPGDNLISTSDSTIPEAEENAHYNNATVDTDTGVQVVPKNQILGAILLFVGVMVIIHFLK
jgi:hypothetical protein